MALETLAILGLAAHRLWFLWLTQEVFRPVRGWLSGLHPKIAYGANCTICTSVWIAAGVGGAWGLDWPYRGLVWVLAISEVLGVVESVLKILGRLEVPRPVWRPEHANGERVER